MATQYTIGSKVKNDKYEIIGITHIISHGEFFKNKDIVASITVKGKKGAIHNGYITTYGVEVFTMFNYATSQMNCQTGVQYLNGVTGEVSTELKSDIEAIEEKILSEIGITVKIESTPNQVIFNLNVLSSVDIFLKKLRFFNKKYILEIENRTYRLIFDRHIVQSLLS